MTGQPVTTNPILIMVINMTIVFGVLFLLGYVIRFIHWADPTKKKLVKEKQSDEVQQVPIVQEIKPEGLANEKELLAVVTTAIMAYGYKNVRIKSIKKS